MQVLSEPTIPSIGGRLIVPYREEEIKELADAKNALALPFAEGRANIQLSTTKWGWPKPHHYRKEKRTSNKYPRKAGLPNKKPL